NSSAFSSSTSSISSTRWSISSFSFLPVSTTLGLAFASSLAGALRFASVFFSCFSIFTLASVQPRVAAPDRTQHTPREKTGQGWARPTLDEQRHDQERDNVDDLDHRIDGGARRIFVGVADRVAGDGSPMGLRPLLPLLFNEFLGVIPCAASARHGDRDEQPGDDRAHEDAAEDLRAE